MSRIGPLKKSNSNISDISLGNDDDNSSISNTSTLSGLNRFIIQSSADTLASTSQRPLNSALLKLNSLNLSRIAQTIAENNDVNPLIMANVASHIALMSAINSTKVITEIASSVPTVGVFNILPPQLLRRSKGEVKITNTNFLKDSSNNPVEVLLSTITPTYNKKLSNIYPELFEVVDKIYNKVDHSTDLDKSNTEIVKLIEKVKDETTGLAKYIPSGP